MPRRLVAFPRAEAGSRPPGGKAGGIPHVRAPEQARMEPAAFVVAKGGSGEIGLQAQPEQLGLGSLCQARLRVYLHASDRRGDLGEGANPPQLSFPPPPLGG